MRLFFDRQGNHVANEDKGYLFAPSGKNIGQFLKKQRIFVDMQGIYLGEIVHGNRLMYGLSSRHRSVNYEDSVNHQDVDKCEVMDNYGTADKYMTIGAVPNHEDIRPERLS